jgi:hypothetical protein
MLGKMGSGIWIADFGPDGEYEQLFQAAENALRQNPAVSIIWAIQESASAGWMSDATALAVWLQRLHQVRRARGSAQVGDVAVLSVSGAKAQALATLLYSLGVGVHQPAPDGAIFVEVHRPDGSIVVGIPGPAFSDTSDRFLHQLNLERDAIEKSPGADAKLHEIRERELAFITETLQNTNSR